MSDSTVDGPVAAAARATMAGARAAEHQVLLTVTALDEAGLVASTRYRRLARLLEDLWRLNPTHARRLVTRAALLTPQVTMTGQAVDPVLPATAAASAAGLLDDGHLRVIAATTDHLARIPGLDPEVFADAEATLAHHATQLAPAGVERIARRLVAHLDPDGTAPPEPDEPVDELFLSRDPDGRLVIAGVVIGRADAELVTEVFDRLVAPAGPDDTRTLAQRRAEVLLDLCAQAASPTGIAAPTSGDDTTHDAHTDVATDGGTATDDADDTAADSETADSETATDSETGEAAQGGDGSFWRTPESEPGPKTEPRKAAKARAAGCPVVPVLGRALLAVTIDLDDLRAETGHGLLDSGHALDPATARRLACDAGIVPTLLGTRGEPLDIGRLAYTVPEGMRRALHQRDRGCSFPGCTRRPARCHAHHITHWADGGPTEIDNLTLCCRYHHHLIHHGGWTITMINGRPWYTPPAWIDPDRTPRPGGPHTATAG